MNESEVKLALAPTGRLRACINLGNPVLAQAGQRGDGPSGLSVDLAHALAERLSLPLELVVVELASDAVDAVTNECADVGFFAVDPQRAGAISFTAPYVLIEGCYLVRAEAPFRDNGEVDQTGVSVVVGKGSAYDLHLSRALVSASLVRSTSSREVVNDLMAQGHDVAAGVRQQLIADAQRLGGLRLLPGRFMVIRQAMGLPRTRGVPVGTYLARFVEDMKSSGFVSEAMHRHGISGASVAAPALVD